MDTSRATVSVVIPVLNEEKTIGRTLRFLKLLDPLPLEVIVVDGGSTDRTREIATSLGAKVLRATKRGRAAQQNTGAEAARGDMVVFLHADTLPPLELVQNVRTTFQDRRTVVGGFTPILTLPDRTLTFMSIHNTIKTYYLPLVFRPLSYAFGLRLMFGDQVLFVRRGEFLNAGGFDATLPIMEDAQLCFTMHAMGPAMKRRANEPGRIRMLSKTCETSGRRIEKMGNLMATYVHFHIGLAWHLGGDTVEARKHLHQLYQTLYGDDAARAR